MSTKMILYSISIVVVGINKPSLHVL